MKKVFAFVVFSLFLTALLFAATKSFASCTDTIKPNNPYFYIAGLVTLTDSHSGGTWASSDPTVATIGSSSGIVTPIKLGTTTITHTNGCSSSIAITVYDITGPACVLQKGTVSATYVTLGGSDFKRVSLATTINYVPGLGDTTIALYSVYTGRVLIGPLTTPNFIYADSSNKRAPSAAALITWLRTNAY